MPPPRYQGRLEGQTATPNENPTTEVNGLVESLLVTRMGRYLLVGGTFMHFGYDHTADPNHLHAGLIALDPTTGALAAWQPSQSSSDSKRRPAFGMANYNGNPRDVGINGDELFFAATGGSGGRVIAWIAGGTKETPLWRGGTDGDAMAVAVTHDRVYLVGHFDHAVIDPNDPCLEYGPLPNGGNGVLCDQETPRRHLVAFDVRGEIGQTGRTPARPSSTRASRPRPTRARARTPSTSAPTGCTSVATSPRWPRRPSALAASDQAGGLRRLPAAVSSHTSPAPDGPASE